MDIAKNIFKKSSIGIIIFFVLNAILIIGLVAAGGSESLFTIFIVYAVSVFIAFSPFGEWILRLMVGARKMTRVDMRIRMIPLYVKRFFAILFRLAAFFTLGDLGMT